MAAFGTDINAGLGKIDYSGQLKGQLMGAEARGEGLNKLVDTAGQVMQGYYKKQEEKKIANFATSNIAAALTTNPAFQKRLGLQSADPKEIGMWLKAVGGGDLTAGAKAGLGIISQLAEEDRQSKDLARIMRTGDVSGAIGGGASPAAVKQFLDIQKEQSGMDLQSAQIRNLNSEAEARDQPKPPEGSVMTSEQLSILEKQGKDYKAVPRPDGQFMVSSISPRGAGQNITVNQGTDMLNQAFSDLSKQKTSEIVPALNAIPAVDAMEELLSKANDQGIITGTFAPAELAAKAALNRVGISNFRDVASTQEYLGASGRLVATVIKDFGAGTGLSDSDRKYAEKIAAGDIAMSKEALVKLVKMARNGINNKVKNYNSDVSRIFSGNTPQEQIGKRLMVPESYLNPGASDEASAAAADQELFKKYGIPAP